MELPYIYQGNGASIYQTYGPPAYKTEMAVGFDLRACMDRDVTVATTHIHWPTRIPLGIAVAVPQGYELQLRARSGLAANYGLSLANGVGTIDPDYRGEIEAALVVHSHKGVQVRPGDRIVQAVIAPVEQMTPTPHNELPETERGAGGFESTGRQ